MLFPLQVLCKKAKYSVPLVNIPGGHHQRTVNGEPLRCKSKIFVLLVSLRESPLQQPIQLILVWAEVVDQLPDQRNHAAILIENLPCIDGLLD